MRVYVKRTLRSPYGTNVMTLAEIIHEEGMAGGYAEGQVTMLLELYKKGSISAKVARGELKALARRKKHAVGFN